MTNWRRLVRFVSFAVLTVSLATGALMAGPVPTGYRIEDLGTFGGPEGCEDGEFPTFSSANGLNESGHAVGWAQRSEALLDPDTGEPLVYPDTGLPVCRYTMHAAMWRDGEVIDLGVLGEGPRSEAYRLNDHDQAVGISQTSGGVHPFLWTEQDGMADLLDDRFGNSRATAINNFGEITIIAEADEAYFRDVNGNLIPLRFPDSPVPGSGEAWDINDDGIVVGFAPRREAGENFLGFRYDSKADRLEENHDPFYLSSFSARINQQGDIAREVGAYTYHKFVAVFSRDGELVVLPLGNLRVRGELRPDLLDGNVYDINDHGDVLGRDESVAYRRGESWVAFDVLADGPIENIHLDDLLNAEDRAEWQIEWASGINEARQIVGRGVHNGRTRAFLMTPDDAATDRAGGVPDLTGSVPSYKLGSSDRAEVEVPGQVGADTPAVPESLARTRRVGSLGAVSSIVPRDFRGLDLGRSLTVPDDGASRITPRPPRGTSPDAGADQVPGSVDRKDTRRLTPTDASSDRASESVDCTDSRRRSRCRK